MSSDHTTSTTILLYRNLFAVLVVVTLLGIAVTFLHLPVVLAVVFALAFILIKSQIVFKTFKPLLKQKTALIILFSLTLILFVAVILLPALTHHNTLTGTVDLGRQEDVQKGSSGEGEHHGH